MSPGCHTAGGTTGATSTTGTAPGAGSWAEGSGVVAGREVAGRWVAGSGAIGSTRCANTVPSGIKLAVSPNPAETKERTRIEFSMSPTAHKGGPVTIIAPS